jgi:hypothetical protein
MECRHPACRERAQLEYVSRHDVDLTTRLRALTFLGMLAAIDRGAYGGVEPIMLFD